MRQRVRLSFVVLWWSSAVGACGGAQTPEPASPEPSGLAERDREQGMQVEGLIGTIPERKIHSTLEPKLPSFQRCFFEGSQEVEFIGGAVQFYFRVGNDGDVESVYLRDSTVGHRETERCLLERARRVSFPKPRGGDGAEFAWGFELDALPDVRPPLPWSEDDVRDAVTSLAPSLDGCSAPDSALVVTAYIAPGGAVMAAGGAASSLDAADQIDCVLQAVESWTLPDPGSYAAKVSFRLP